MPGRSANIPAEALLALRGRLTALPSRSAGRAEAVGRMAELYGVSVSSVYRQLRDLNRPKRLCRSDRGTPRCLPQADMERYCEIVAALKIRTENNKGHKLSTNRAVELLEDFGVETPDGFVKVPKGLLKVPTVNRWLRALGYDRPRMTRGPAAVRFEARHSNDLWQFDMSPSDLKEVDQPIWVDPERGRPTLMLYSVIDDRSGLAYQEYRCVYGEDAESALRFLFNAMAPKEDTLLQGRPGLLYLDNGPVARSIVFQTVMHQLGINWRTHMPKDSDGRRVTARSKGKVERPFRTVKEAHETLYHFHKPAPTRGSASRALIMRSIPIWPARKSLCGGACSTRNCSSSLATSALVPTIPQAAQSRCIIIGAGPRRRVNDAPTRWPSLLSVSPCRARRAPASPT